MKKKFFYIKARESCPVPKNMHTLLYMSNLIFLMYFLAVFQMCIGICFTFAYQTIKRVTGKLLANLEFTGRWML